MNRVINRWALLVGVLILAYGCKKKGSDGEGPSIEWIYPAPMGNVFSIDTFLVSATIVDEDGVERVSLRLANAAGTTIANVPDVFPQSSNYQFESYFILNRPDLLGGTYYLNIEAYDSEKRSSAYREINLNPVPWELHSTVVAYGNPNSATVAERNDSNSDWAVLPAIPGDVRTLEALHIDDLILVVSAFDGQIQALRYPDFETAWTHEIPNNTNWRAIESIGVNPRNGESAVADTDRLIEIVNHEGNVVLGFDSDLTQYVPIQCALTGSRVYLVERRLDGTDQQFSVFYRVSGALETRLYFPGEVVALFSEPADEYVDDDIVILLNDFGTPRLKVFDPIAFGFDQPVSLPDGEMFAACKISTNRYLFQIDNTIYHYDFGGPLQVFYTADVAFSHMIYDLVNEEVLALSGSEMYVFTLQGAALGLIEIADLPGDGHALVQLRNR